MTRCQRWRERHDNYQAPATRIDPSRFAVEPIPEKAAKAFVVRHHYSGSYPAARFRVGLFRKAHQGHELVGVAVFSVPMNQRVIPARCGVAPNDGVELGRFVLLDDVEGNGETWFLARAFKALRAELGVRAVLSYSDPVPRQAADGRLVTPGHIGTIYQAHNAAYVGRGSARTLLLDASGRVYNLRSLCKLRNDERGAGGAYEAFLAAGAPRRRAGEDSRSYVARALQDGGFRRLRHPGNYAYVWRLDKRRLTPASQPYPKARDEARWAT